MHLQMCCKIFLLFLQHWHWIVSDACHETRIASHRESLHVHLVSFSVHCCYLNTYFLAQSGILCQQNVKQMTLRQMNFRMHRAITCYVSKWQDACLKMKKTESIESDSTEFFNENFPLFDEICHNQLHTLIMWMFISKGQKAFTSSVVFSCTASINDARMV